MISLVTNDGFSDCKPAKTIIKCCLEHTLDHIHLKQIYSLPNLPRSSPSAQLANYCYTTLDDFGIRFCSTFFRGAPPCPGRKPLASRNVCRGFPRISALGTSSGNIVVLENCSMALAQKKHGPQLLVEKRAPFYL